LLFPTFPEKPVKGHKKDVIAKAAIFLYYWQQKNQHLAVGEDDGVDVLAFRMPHKAIPRYADVSEYLVSIRSIEDETGLDFLDGLSDDLQNLLETTVWDLWPDL